MAPMQIDTQLSGLEDAPDHARRLEELGVDGAFTFEGPHDVFTPLVLAAGGHQPARAGHQRGHRLPPQPGPAGPPGLRPPTADPGPVHPGPRFPDPGPGGEAVRRLVRPAHRPDAGAGRGPAGHLRHLGDRRATGLPGRVLLAHLDAPDVQPRTASPSGCHPSPSGGLGPQMVRLAAEVADGLLVMPFNTAAHFAQRTLPAVQEGLARAGRKRSELMVTGEVIVCCGTRPRRSWTRPARPAAGCSPSTPRPRPTDRSWRSRGGRISSPSSTVSPRRAGGRRCRTCIDDTMLGALAAVGVTRRGGGRHRGPFRRAGRPGGLLHSVPGDRRDLGGNGDGAGPAHVRPNGEEGPA